jgi:3-hydroxyisobutyrate dehydrogenase-like beta-hydroxyacid dehydrogenase
MSQAARAVGFIGLGSIGGPMAERILQAGHQLHVYDIRPEAMAAFRGRAELSSSPREMADHVDTVLGCLASSSSFQEALLGHDGIVAGHRAKQYVHLGTNGSAVVQDLATGLAAAAIATLDAPMTGGRQRAQQGTLTVMVSGPRALFDAVEPLLRCYGNKIVYLGASVGAAQVMKSVNNMLSLTNLVAACEALVVGAKAGLDPETMLDVINNGSGQNTATSQKVPRHILGRSFDFGGSLAVVLKDIGVFIDHAAALGITTPVGDLVMRAYQTAIQEGSDKQDITTVIRPMEKKAGVTLQSRSPGAAPAS